MSGRILLIEDEELIGTMVEMNLARDGYAVVWAKDGKRALDLGLHESFDLILLDIAMPSLDGYAILESLRAHGCATHVMMLTARGDVPSKVRAFSAGADDYLAKPFELAELLARVGAVFRRARG